MERYETPQMEVILFETEDVITTSSTSTWSLADNELDVLLYGNGE